MARRRRHHRRRYSNPFSPKALLDQPKQLLKADFAMEAVAVTGGFVLPGMVMNYVPVTLRDVPWKFYLSKVAVISGLAAAGTLIKQRIGRMILLGGGVSLLMDVFQSFMSARSAAPSAARAYYGPGIHAYYGDLDATGVSTDSGDLVEDNEGSTF